MAPSERSTLYCDLIHAAQSRMEQGSAIAFNRHHPQQRAACQRMLRYVEVIRWLYDRARKADEATTLAFRDSLRGLAWPYGGIDDADIPFFRLMASGEFKSVEPNAYPFPVESVGL